MKKLLVAVVLLIASSTFAAAPGVTGQWSVHTSIADNEIDSECKFVQTEAKLTGTCEVTEKEVQIAGSVDGKKVTWKYDTEYNGSPLSVTYTGTLDDAGKIAGSIDVAPMGVSGTFTAAPSKKAGKT